MSTIARKLALVIISLVVAIDSPIFQESHLQELDMTCTQAKRETDSLLSWQLTVTTSELRCSWLALRTDCLLIGV
jgi:hypothetical protein